MQNSPHSRFGGWVEFNVSSSLSGNLIRLRLFEYGCKFFWGGQGPFLCLLLYHVSHHEVCIVQLFCSQGWGGGGEWISRFRCCQPDLALEGSPSSSHLAVSATNDNA